ncbi:MAG: DUF4340 domain-containing protein [Candidatus Aureabacteria bacterium]|nr:DUF4340 domain-containing protein [Candidatus Auribacterota bacterium]
MKFRTTLILLIVALGIGSYIWFFEKKTMSTNEQEEKGKLVFHVKADDIDRIELVKGKENVVCVKDKAGDWQIEQPLKYKADKSPLSSIVSRLESLNSVRIIPRAELDEKKIEEFGLTKPRLTVRFTASGTKDGLSIGSDTPIGNNVYAKSMGGNDILVVDKNIRQVIDKGVKDLRDRGVLDFEIGDLGKVQIISGDQRVELVQESGVWRLTSPVQGLADPDKVSGMLRKIKHAQVRDFTSDSPKDLAVYGLDKPRGEITLWDAKGQSSKTLLLGKEAEKNVIYATRAGTDAVVTVGDDVLKDLTRSPHELRDLKVTHLAQGGIEEIQIRSGDKKLVLAKAGEKWKIKEPEKKEAEGAQVQDLLRMLTELKVAEFVADKPVDYERYGKKEAMEIVLKPRGGEAETILVGKKFDGGKKAYLKRARSEEICAVSADFLQRCSLDPLHYMKRQVMDFNSSDVKKFTITKSQKPRVVCEKSQGNEWQMVEPEKRRANASQINTILSNLSKLCAREFVEQSPNDLKKYGLDKPSYEVSLDLEKGSSPPSLRIGGKAEGGAYYAKLSDSSSVFTIPSSLEENLRKDLTSAEKPTPGPAPTAKAGKK